MKKKYIKYVIMSSGSETGATLDYREKRTLKEAQKEFTKLKRKARETIKDEYRARRNSGIKKPNIEGVVIELLKAEHDEWGHENDYIDIKRETVEERGKTQ